ncbi:uncharacterized protein LOC100905077 [Galendromus occidentalis]|uniref:Uncharacterized protein LOC100905077 n=1 Tax=Galendromus occidentalis TaxID=34638 RepID=A0AAJ6VVQ5_9ACAR|nr:uncharacterized protein LOC100905077 [Galendromus occidentalis]
MTLAKWKTNSGNVADHLLNTGADPETFEEPRTEVLKVLGLLWEPVGDVFRFTIPPASYRFYTDSAITFHWVTFANPGAWKTYVSNRVTEIRANSRPEEWFHVKGKSNIADLATRAAATELKRLFNTVRNPDVREVLNGRTIDWSFITPRMPSHGGFYERAAGILKSALIKTLGRSLIGYEEFRTVLCELAAIINERPLMYVSNDANEPTSITPAHFLRGGSFHRSYAGPVQNDKLRSDELATADDLRRGLALRTTYFKSVSVRWFREYLSLHRSANATRGKRSPPIRVDDVCILREDIVARVRWPLVRVIEAHAGRDGLVRTYTVKFADSHTSRRAAQLLYPLEVTSEDLPRLPTSDSNDTVTAPPE